MKASFLAAVLATAVSVVSAGVLVKRPALPPSPSSSSSSSSSSAAPTKASSPCRVANNGLYACFRASTDNALSYCSTDASIYLAATTTQVLEPGPTIYVTVASDTVTEVVSTDLSVVDEVVTTSTHTVYSGVTTAYTTLATTQTTTVYLQEARKRRDHAGPAPTLFVLKRDGSGIEAYEEDKVGRREDGDHDGTTTVGVLLKRTTLDYTITTCTTTTQVTVTEKRKAKKAKRTAAVAPRFIAPASVSSSSSTSSSSGPSANPPPACLETLAAPAPAALSSACSAIVSQFGATPTVTNILALPATTVTVASGVSTAVSVERTTSTSTTFTVYQVTEQTTTTIPMCTLVTKTITETGA
ncbi:hypothetical protein SCUCBS95973_009763 [Sporothrix curviconia]|uniref:Uncharacterized protein n=1 Tax=Sporothrix curviconia TaxID=1260050 RepID=A0ABP0CXN0_9PEZI